MPTGTLGMRRFSADFSLCSVDAASFWRAAEPFAPVFLHSRTEGLAVPPRIAMSHTCRIVACCSCTKDNVILLGCINKTTGQGLIPSSN